MRLLLLISFYLEIKCLFSVEDIPLDADDVESWNDMERDAHSLRNTYQVDVDDAGVALTGVSEYMDFF